MNPDHIEMTQKIEIFDTTLRDGAQAKGISFSVEDKMRIIQTLSELGISYIEIGHPYANPKDSKLFASVSDDRLDSTRYVAFGSTRRKDIAADEDPNLRMLVSCGAKTVAIFGKSWKLHVDEILATTEEENLAMIRESVAFLKQAGCEVHYDAEHFFDGYKDDPAFAMRTVRAAFEAGADCITLCDTNGGSLCEEIYEITKTVCETFPVKIGIHCHDDLGLATASSIAAVRAGARLVQGTLIGFGERCGNASLSAIIPTLQFRYGFSCISKDAMRKLTFTVRKVAELANISLPKFTPYVGANAFVHKAGMHMDGILKNPRSFEHIEPELVGNSRKLLTSEMAGRHAIFEKIEKYVPQLTKDAPEILSIMHRIKELEQNGYTFEAAEASFELMVLRAASDYQPRFELVHFKTIGEQPCADDETATAVIKLRVGKDVAINAAEGNGPVHALDTALRKTLDPFFPRLKESYLCDFKVRVLNPEAATAAKVRVLMTSTDGMHVWSTVGVSGDVLEASWIALSDAIEYKLILDDRTAE